jgi:hypothetical protein
VPGTPAEAYRLSILSARTRPYLKNTGTINLRARSLHTGESTVRPQSAAVPQRDQPEDWRHRVMRKGFVSERDLNSRTGHLTDRSRDSAACHRDRLERARLAIPALGADARSS